jgi:hypothetical protein
MSFAEVVIVLTNSLFLLRITSGLGKGLSICFGTCTCSSLGNATVGGAGVIFFSVFSIRSFSAPGFTGFLAGAFVEASDLGTVNFGSYLLFASGLFRGGFILCKRFLRKQFGFCNRCYLF